MITKFNFCILIATSCCCSFVEIKVNRIYIFLIYNNNRLLKEKILIWLSYRVFSVKSID